MILIFCLLLKGVGVEVVSSKEIEYARTCISSG